MAFFIKKTDIITVKVADMNCGHCEKAISKALMGLEGVETVKASSSTKKVEVSIIMDRGPSLEQINQAITEAGYTPGAL